MAAPADLDFDMSPEPPDLMSWLLVAAAAIVVVLLSTPSRAHDQYHDWKIPGTTTSCCDDKDCAPRRARMSDEETWEVWYEGRWLHVPARSVLPFPSPDGRSHACIIGSTVLCFVPGEIRG